MNNTVTEEQRYVDRQAVYLAAEKLIDRCADQMDKCLTLPEQSNRIWLQEKVGEAPALLRKVELRLVTQPRKGYVLLAVPVFADTGNCIVDSFYGGVCSGTMDEMLEYLRKAGRADDLAHQFITLTRLSFHEYWFQKVWDAIRDGTYKLCENMAKYIGMLWLKCSERKKSEA